MICGKCGKEQIRFGTYRCKSCRDIYHAKWRKQNRDKWNAKSRKWVAENREKRKEVQKKHESKNRDERLAKRRLSYKEGRRKKGYKQNPIVRLRLKNRRRARLAQVPRENYDSSKIYEAFNNRCTYCGSNAECLDHVIPISRGGPDIVANLVASCRSCNTSKGSKLIHEWMAC